MLPAETDMLNVDREKKVFHVLIMFVHKTLAFVDALNSLAMTSGESQTI